MKTPKVINLYYLIAADSILCVLLISLTAALFPIYGSSLLVGCLVYFIPAWIFAWLSLKDSGAKKSLQVVRGFYLAELIKYLVTLMLFGYVFLVLTLNSVMAVFIGYFFSTLIHPLFVAYLIIYKKRLKLN